MKSFKISTLILIVTLFLSASACNDKYPDLEDGLYAEFITNKGTMVAKLFYKNAPVTVANFVALAEGNHPLVSDEFKGKKYYNGTTFHRVIDQFMIQGGDPTATGSGGPGYKFDDEFHPDLKHDKPGILSMANSGPNTNGSQFFITEKETPFLDAFKSDGTLKRCGTFPGGSCHAVFGVLVKGLDVQDSISNVETKNDKPVEDVVIVELNIIRKGLEAKTFDAPKIFTEESPKLKEKLEEIKENQRKETEEKANEAKEEFLKNNESLEGEVVKSDTGIAMIYIEKGNDKKPTSANYVLINYAGYFTDGSLFDTNLKSVAEKYGKYNENRKYEPFSVIYNEQARLAAGFREAMLKMNVGDKVRVFVPYYLGYGETGSGPIPPYTNLIFDIELVGIDK